MADTHSFAALSSLSKHLHMAQMVARAGIQLTVGVRAAAMVVMAGLAKVTRRRLVVATAISFTLGPLAVAAARAFTPTRPKSQEVLVVE